MKFRGALRSDIVGVNIVLQNLFFRTLGWHAKSRHVGSRELAIVARNYLMHYCNADSRIEHNGEAHIIQKISPGALEVAFDVGANVGQWSSLVLARFPRAQCHAFEAAPNTAALLRERLGSDHRLRINEVGLSDQKGTLALHYDADHNDMSTFCAEVSFLDQGATIDVPVIRGDDYCSLNGVRSIDFLKIDVEGFELKVLQGFQRMLHDRLIKAIQFEHNRFAVFSGVYVWNYYELLGQDFEIGPLLPTGVEFSEYSVELEEYRFGNFVAVRRGESDLRHQLAFPG